MIEKEIKKDFKKYVKEINTNRTIPTKTSDSTKKFFKDYLGLVEKEKAIIKAVIDNGYDNTGYDKNEVDIAVRRALRAYLHSFDNEWWNTLYRKED